VISNDLKILSSQSRAVTSVNGTHLDSMQNDLVVGIHSHGQNIHYMPTGLESIFTNIKLLDFTYGRIKEIHQEDLKPFPKLVYCGFKDNDIEILEDGLFDYNPEIQLISFWNNKILYVGVHLFNGLTKLSAIYFDENQCIKMRAAANVTAVQDMIKQVKHKCTYDPKQQIDKLQYSLDDLKKNGPTSINGKTAELEAKNHKLTKEFDASMEKIKDLESKFSYLESKISRLSEYLDSCRCANDL